MSRRETGIGSGERAEIEAGIAVRYGVIRDALRRKGPLTWREIRSELTEALGDSGKVPLQEDLATLEMGRWIRPVADDARKFELVEDAESRSRPEA